MAHDIRRDPGAGKNLLEDCDHEWGEGTMGRVDCLASNDYDAPLWQEQVARLKVAVWSLILVKKGDLANAQKSLW